jgi:hypothetical protein
LDHYKMLIVLSVIAVVSSCAPRVSLRDVHYSPPQVNSCESLSWEGKTVSVYISSTFPDDMFGEDDELFREILDNWNHPDSSIRLIFRGRRDLTPRYEKCSDGISRAIYIYWERDSWGGGNTTENPSLGVEYTCYRRNTILKSIIFINASDYHYAPLSRRASRTRNEYDVRLIILHELGHSLGFAQCNHDIDNYRSIMFPSFMPGEVFHHLDPTNIKRLLRKYPRYR